MWSKQLDRRDSTSVRGPTSPLVLQRAAPLGEIAACEATREILATTLIRTICHGRPAPKSMPSCYPAGLYPRRHRFLPDSGMPSVLLRRRRGHTRKSPLQYFEKPRVLVRTYCQDYSAPASHHDLPPCGTSVQPLRDRLSPPFPIRTLWQERTLPARIVASPLCGSSSELLPHRA